VVFTLTADEPLQYISKMKVISPDADPELVAPNSVVVELCPVTKPLEPPSTVMSPEVEIMSAFSNSAPHWVLLPRAVRVMLPVVVETTDPPIT
jgi:hypothetical protein